MNKEKSETLLENYQALSELYSNIRKELDHTRKALDIAVDALKRIDDIYKVSRVGVQEGIFMGEYAHRALLAILSPEEAQMRTLEQINQKEEQ